MARAPQGGPPATEAPTMGVEEEFLLVGRDGLLAHEGQEVIAEAGDGPAELVGEFARCQVEAAGPVCTTGGELLTELRAARRRLGAAASRRGLRLLAAGAPVLAERQAPPLNPAPRYTRIAEHFGGLANLAASSCGCHVHVAVPDPETATRVINHLRPWLPFLLALSANSPYCEGTDTGYASWRHQRWSNWPSAGPPPHLASAAHYDACVTELLHTGAALDPGMLYWDIRRSAHHPTVEVRICDIPQTAEETALIAVLVRALVRAALDDIAADRPPLAREHTTLRADLWHAAREGFAGRCADPLAAGAARPARDVAERALERLRPYLADTGDLALAEEVLGALGGPGGGAARQRAAFAARGRLTDVVDHLATATLDGLVLSAAPQPPPAHARPAGG
ncbi:glutamate--cysteine ligase [Streptomonospora sp. S1-112]|uniref:Putative glutamate--cysteine ligase 2 n=2 Tax=Streptomonospora mangrovi TaxID=2883123 RepID=A0A9X3SG28_9ACTN|nr:glutamate--cysteine ligase [Streptomonospora mangrovi]